MKVYRAWINQPSKHQPLSMYHGLKGIVVENNGVLIMYFSEGRLISLKIPNKQVITKG